MSGNRDILAERAEIDALVEGRTLCDLFAETAAARADHPALLTLGGDGAWAGVTWAEYAEQVRSLALGLRELGVQRGDFVLLMARNIPQHVIADLAVVHAGAVPVTVYNTSSVDQLAYLVDHCKPTAAIIEVEPFLERFETLRPQAPSLRRIVTIGDSRADDWLHAWDDVLAAGRAQNDEAAAALRDEVTAEDPATVIYTSGTTGPPKGVIITQRMVLWTLESLGRMAPLHPDERFVSYLPLAHAAERFLSHWQLVRSGGTTHFCPDATRLAEHLAAARPTFFAGVPRIWEKFAAALQAGIAAAPPTVRDAVEVSRRCRALAEAGMPVSDDLAGQRDETRPVLGALTARLGLDQCRIALSGAAPIAPDVIGFFHDLGLTIAEVWGMTELTSPATLNPLDRVKIGTVGVALPGVEVQVAADGELLVRGGNRMPGYYADDERTLEAIDDEGFMHTGDIGTVDDEGYFRVVDRKKELIITAGGKNVSPATIENLLKQHPLVGQTCVIGDRRPYIVALVVLDPEGAASWASGHDIGDKALAVLSQSPVVIDELQRFLDEANQKLSRVERVKRFAVLPVEWTAESEELTPTLKLKRRVIESKYADVIETLYGAGTTA